MKVVFTKNNSPMSKAIRWVLNEPVSHVAVIFDDKLVFQANLLGVHVGWADTFLKKNEVVYTKEYANLSLEEQEVVYEGIINKYDGSSYDFKSLLYFAYRAMLKKLFKVPIPKMNPYNNINQFLCTELLMHILIFTDEEDKIVIGETDMLTPYEMYQRLK